MKKTVSASGSCVCGSVQVTAKTISPEIHACHCGMCRKWGDGGPALSVDCGTEVIFSGQDNISTYSSSPWAQRGFCNNCGTHLFYQLKEAAQYIIPVGIFDNLSGLHFAQQIFIDRKPEYYDFANQTQNLTEAEVFAKYAPQND